MNWKIEKEGFTLICSDGKLVLKSKDMQRNIGSLNEEGDYIKKGIIRDKHLFKKLNAYGINYEVIDFVKRFIIIIDDIEKLIVPIKFIKAKLNFLYFKKQGFEKQIFIPLEYFDKYNFKNEIMKHGTWEDSIRKLETKKDEQLLLF